MKYQDIGSNSMLECPVCGYRVKFRWRTESDIVLGKPRASDLAKHIVLKSVLDPAHKNWIQKMFGSFPVEYETVREYLEKAEYEKVDELLGIKIYRPIL